MPTHTSKPRPNPSTFGSSLTTRSFSAGSGFRFGFNTQEKDKEIYNNNETYTATFWEYDGRLGRRWNIDIKIPVFLSRYSSLENNPLKLIDLHGDSSVWDNKGYMIHYDPKDKDLRAFMKNGKNLTLIGQLGKKIDATTWFPNLLQENSKIADDMWNPLNFKNHVQKYGIWDYKYLSPANPNANSKQHILGVAFYRKDKDKGTGDLQDTKFIINGIEGRAEDYNNFHFGVIAKSYGLFTEKFLLETAGKIEMEKWEEEGKQVPVEWRPIITIKPTSVPATWYQVLGAPYGDNPIDHEWIKMGFNYYNSNID